MNTKTQSIISGGYTFPMKTRERDRLLNSMTPDARARFYDREMEAHTRLKGLNEAEEADAAYERQKASGKPR